MNVTDIKQTTPFMKIGAASKVTGPVAILFCGRGVKMGLPPYSQWGARRRYILHQRSGAFAAAG